MSKLILLAEAIKFEHTVFALPFAYLGAILAGAGLPSWTQLFWITLGLMGARNTAMGFNRIIDRHIDAANPRTQERHLPRGLLQVRDIFVMSLISAAVFLYAIHRLSPRHLLMGLLILFFLIGYSYTKRFTAWSHLVLGIADGFAPVAGWLAMTQRMEWPALELGLAVAFWIAGFDIIYALLDLEFDRRYGLHSLPLALGPAKALHVSRLMHLLTFVLLLASYFQLQLGGWFLCGLAAAGLLLIYEHALVSPRDFSRVNLAFFHVNGVISLVLLFCTLLDVTF